jgi:hypothetical protein
MQAVTTIGLDSAKSVFQVHGVDAEGVGDDGQGRTLQGTSRARGLNEITPGIRCDVKVGRANST